MFESLGEFFRGKECQCCGIKIPKNFTPINSDYEDYCSIECSSISEECFEIIENNPDYDYDEIDKKRFEVLHQRVEKQKKKMEQKFAKHLG